MRIMVFDDAAQWAAAAADMVQDVLQSKEKPVLVLPTGSTPIPVYAELVRRHKAGEVSFAHAVTVNLDEYVGLNETDPESYHYFMQTNLFAHVDAKPENVHLPRLDTDPEAACEEYNALYAAEGPADIALLGLGHNGHIGFNEPGSPFTARTRVVTLSESTLQANRIHFGARAAQMPTHAMTMGPAMIMEARKVLLMVTGAGKAEILKKVLTAPVSEDIPGTLLQQHPDLVVLADRAAAAQLEGI